MRAVVDPNVLISSRISDLGNPARIRQGRAVSDLDQDWSVYDRLNVSDPVSYLAGELAERHALRGYDAVHLASAVRLSERFGDLNFLAFDVRLNDAARAADLAVYGDESRARLGADG